MSTNRSDRCQFDAFGDRADILRRRSTNTTPRAITASPRNIPSQNMKSPKAETYSVITSGHPNGFTRP
jgi:hypothetical protein